MSRFRTSEHVGPSICEALEKALPKEEPNSPWHRLPDGTDVLIGTERIYPAVPNSTAGPCEVDLGGDVPFVCFRNAQKG
jgi:hypothetical protein